MKKLIIHIGSENTDTQYIQNFLSSNRNKLLAQGIYYPDIGFNRSAQFSLVAAFHEIEHNRPLEFAPNQEKGGYTIESEWLPLIREINSRDDINTIIVSSEHFSSRLRDKSILLLKDLLKSLDATVEILYYFRRQDDLMASAYNTFIRSGGVLSLAEFYMINKNRKWYFDAEHVASAWKNIFNPESFIVKSYDLVKNNIIEDFCVTTGLYPVLSKEIIDSSSRSRGDEWNPKMLKIGRVINEEVINNERQINYEVIKKIYEGISYTDVNMSILGKDQREEILEIYEKSNKNICNKFDLDYDLIFHDKFPDDSVSPDNIDFTVEDLMTFSSFNEECYGFIGSIYFKYYFVDPASPLVITFAPWGGIDEDLAKSGGSPWGYEFIKSKSLNILSFSTISGKENYYRDSIFLSQLENIGNIIPKFPERLGYGNSMGGYAVSAFSNPLKIDRVLLLDPVSSRRKDIATWDYNGGRNLRSFDFDWSGMYTDGADTIAKGYVVYDPLFDLDKKHATRYHSLTKLRVPGVGHSMPQHLQSMHMLGWVVDGFIKDELSIKEFYKKARSRRNISQYYEWMLSSQNKKLTTRRMNVIRNYYIKIKNDLHTGERLAKNYESFFILNDIQVTNVVNMAISLENIDMKTSYQLMLLVLERNPKNSYYLQKTERYKKVLDMT